MLKAILKIVSFILLMIVILSTTLFLRPQILVNQISLKVLASYLNKKGVSLSWSDFSRGGETQNISRRTFFYAFKDFCVFSKNPNIQILNGCLREVQVGFAIEFGADFFKIVEVGPFVLKGSDLVVRIPQTEKSNTKPIDWRRFLPDRIGDLKLQSLNIDLQNTSFERSGETTSFDIQMHTNTDPYKLLAKATVRLPSIGKLSTTDGYYRSSGIQMRGQMDNLNIQLLAKSKS